LKFDSHVYTYIVNNMYTHTQFRLAQNSTVREYLGKTSDWSGSSKSENVCTSAEGCGWGGANAVAAPGSGV
jgi:hypothetical protein